MHVCMYAHACMPECVCVYVCEDAGVCELTTAASPCRAKGWIEWWSLSLERKKVVT